MTQCLTQSPHEVIYFIRLYFIWGHVLSFSLETHIWLLLKWEIQLHSSISDIYENYYNNLTFPYTCFMSFPYPFTIWCDTLVIHHRWFKEALKFHIIILQKPLVLTRGGNVHKSWYMSTDTYLLRTRRKQGEYRLVNTITWIPREIKPQFCIL